MFRIIIVSLFLSMLSGSDKCIAQENNPAAEKRIFIYRQDTLPYRLMPPSGKHPPEKYPLVIYLHGSGSRGNDNEKPLQMLPSMLLDSAMRATHPCFILVPQCAANDAWVAFPRFPESLESQQTKAQVSTIQLIRHLIEVENIDPRRIYLTGYSLGAEGTYDMIARTPGLFACGVPLAGLADTSKVSLLISTPMWAFHGTEDKVIDIEYHRMIVNAIRQSGGDIKFTVFQGVGHDCKAEAYNKPELWAWMFEQKGR